VVDDETGFLAQASRAYVGLIPVSCHYEQIRVDRRGCHLVSGPPAGPDPAAWTVEARRGGGKQLIS
jgi:hypothetical protein